MNKGIIMEITNKHYIIMRPDGRFERVSRRKRACQIGEEIEYERAGAGWKRPSVAARLAIAAAVVFCLVVFASFNGKLGSPEVVAYITMDINPSVEIGIDVQENVLELRGLNDDGNLLIEMVDFKGKNLEQVTERLLDNAERDALARGEGEIVISSTVVQPDSQVNDESIAERMKQQVTKHIETTHPQQAKQYQVAAFAAPAEVREAASQNGVSTGKYTVYLNAKNSGADVTLDQFKKESVTQISKSKPEVAQSIQPDRVPSKADLKQLVQDEKTGELDKKLTEKKTSDKNGKSTTGNKADQNKTTSSGKAGTGSNQNGNSSNAKDDPKKTNGSTGKNGNNRNDDDDDDDRKSSGNSRNNKDSDKDDKGKNSSSTGKPGSAVTQPGSSKPGTSGSGGSRDKDDDKKGKNDPKEEAKRAEEARKKAEEQRKKQEEEQKKQEEQRKKQEAERKKAEDQKKNQAEEQKKKQDEEQKKKQDEEQKKKQAEEQKKKQDEEQKKKQAEEQKKKQAEEQKKKQDEDQKKKQAEEQKKKQNEEQRKQEDAGKKNGSSDGRS
ncbi:anti-sigma factor domain-containing protein [Paenibacillus puerhi]|uniref:anti-sigma factor domain-containing protein n=1 Tax=Paenibacillus puerhi TaxID=2692622 RepID=UPI0019153AE0|nr:anti-sigma factor domain-containing protein [Paenibacillus puerhi]